MSLLKKPVLLASRLVLLLAFLIAAPSSAEAQFFKNWFKKDRKENKKETEQEIRQKEPARIPAVRSEFTYPPTIHKPRYRVDVLLSLYLDELVSDNKAVYKDKLPEKAGAGVNFYEGIKLAADSLSKTGYKIDLYIHDITQEGLAPEELIKNQTLDQSDLIIGMLSSSQISVIAPYAKEKKINFISAFSPSDADVRNNPFFTILQPTLATHCGEIARYVHKKYPEEDILLFYRESTAVDLAAYSYMTEVDSQHIRPVSVERPLSREQLQAYFKPGKQNVILFPIMDATLAEGLLMELDEWFPGYSFEIYGMPSWRNIAFFRQPDISPDIVVYFSTPFYFDYTLPLGQLITNGYRKEFKGKPGEMVFWGYEVFFQYARMLKEYGTVFNGRKMLDKNNSFFNYIDVRTKRDAGQTLYYNENRQICLYRYQGGSFMIIRNL